MEIGRMVFINVVTIGLSASIYRIPNVPQWVFWVFGFGPMIIFWWFYIRYSIGRMIQIKGNKKHAIAIKKDQIPLLLEAYPKQKLWTKTGGKYKEISSSDDIDDDKEILLICIGKKPVYELRKIKRVLKDDK